jgi:REP element-mobilizing transposase RayT
MASQFRTRNYRPYGLVHITSRELARQSVFMDDSDRATFISHLSTSIHRMDREVRPRLLAWALMSNHVHLMFQHGPDPTAVPRLIRSVKVRYAQHFNARHCRSGSLWETPFRGRVVRGGEDLVNVITYIHLNPDSSLRHANSSHGIYIGAAPPGIVDTSLVLKTFGGPAEYADFFDDTSNIRAARAAAKRRINK